MHRRESRSHVILGDGAAGMAAALALRGQASADRIVVVSDDPHPYYYRAALTNHLLGELREDELWALPPESWKDLRFEHVRDRAVRLDHARGMLHLAAHEPLRYDTLLVATGARARRLRTPAEDPKGGTPGADLPGVHYLRTYQDTCDLKDRAEKARHAVVIGAGILGLEIAQGLAARGLHVTVLHRAPWILERVVDRTAAEIVRSRMERDGVRVITQAEVAAIEGTGKGVTGVRLKDRTTLPATLVVAAIGIEPNTEWLARSGVETRRGFLPVDRRMRVAGVEGIWAAGDVADFEDASLPFRNATGLWQPAVRQGRVAGLDMAEPGSDASVEYRPGAVYNATTAWDLDLATIGDSADAERDAVVRRGEIDGKPFYKKALLRDGCLVGVLLLGDRREGQALRRLMNLRGEAANVSAVAEDLFDPRFDLFSWVAAQERAPGVRGWYGAVPLPGGAVPHEWAGVAHPTTQRQLAVPRAGETSRLAPKPPPPIRLSANGTSRTFEKGRARIGARAECEFVVDDPQLGADEWVVALEGMVWMLHPPDGRAGAGHRNGEMVSRTTVLRQGDVLLLGATKVFVTIDRSTDTAAPARPARGACLLGPRERHALDRDCTRIGSSADNDVVLDVKGVARSHAQVLRRGSPASWYAVDAGSGGRTSVNGAPIATHTRLRPKDVLGIGEHVVLTYEETDEEVRAGPSEQTRAVPLAERIYLLAREGPLKGKALVVENGGTIGRGSEATVRIDDALLSRRHARFERRGSVCRVTDLESANGTSVKGERITAGSAVTLSPGDEVLVGRNRFRLALEPPATGVIEASDGPAPAGADDATHRIEHNVHSLVEHQAEKPQVHQLTGDEVRVGRASDNDVVLQGVGLSRHHAKFVRKGKGYAVVDLKSTHGTTVGGGEKLVPDAPRSLEHGDVIRLGSKTLTYAVAGGADPLAPPSAGAAPGATLTPLDAVDAAKMVRPAVLRGPGPWVLGRDSGRSSVHVAIDKVSGVHALVRRSAEAFEIQNRSQYGTCVNGEKATNDGWTPLEDGDEVLLQDVPFRFEIEVPRRDLAPAGRGDRPRAFHGEAFSALNPLESDLERLKDEEVEACIGCHECMRACPLPDAPRVTIAALNAYALGVGEPGETVLRFVNDCTQCQMCVPVCPVDIHRSRIVLWNKLKRAVDPGQVLPLQVGDQQAESRLTIADAAEHLARHEVFGRLSAGARSRLAATARCRLLEGGEVLVPEGTYPDALWLVLDGFLEVGIATQRERFLGMVRLGPGQTVGEAALFSDSPAEATARARGQTLVLGVPRHALLSARGENADFAAALEGLYLSRSLDAALARLDLDAGAAKDLGAALRAERYDIGQVILRRTQAHDTFGVVARGFVKEIRRRGPKERVANYLKTGDVLGGPDGGGRDDALLRYEAATKVEIFSVRRDRLLDLERRHPGLLDRLLPEPEPEAERHADATGSFSCPGGTGILQATKLLVIDTRLCVDCNNCVDACERRHGTARLERENAGLQQGPWQVPASCYHCADPVCLFCSVNGIVREPTGEIRIIEQNCIGCGACAERCPYGNIFMRPREPRSVPLIRRIVPKPILRLFGVADGEVRVDDSARVAVKCDLCVGHADGPACVRSCPTGAARREDPKELFGVGRGS